MIKRNLLKIVINLKEGFGIYYCAIGGLLVITKIIKFQEIPNLLLKKEKNFLLSIN
jgi:hypothetical protein